MGFRQRFVISGRSDTEGPILGFIYADNTCKDCGKKIVCFRPMHNGTKTASEQATEVWMRLQKACLVRCITCATAEKEREMERLEKRGAFNDV